LVILFLQQYDFIIFAYISPQVYFITIAIIGMTAL